jgi:hypothetical protein
MTAVSICDLDRALLGRSGKGGLILVVAAFFDDSGTHPDSPVVAIGGLLGTVEQWDAFGAAWGELLETPLPGKPKLSQFHLSPCRALRDEFRDYSRADSDRITYLFRQVILSTGLVTVAAAVDRTAWNELVVGEIAEQLGQPDELCFVKCIDSIVGIVRLQKPEEKILIAFDRGTRAHLEPWAAACLAQSEIYPEIAGIGFAKVSEVLALQGADMIATETYQYAQEWIKDGEDATPNPHFKDYLKRDLSCGLIIDRARIEEVVARVRETLSR